MLAINEKDFFKKIFSRKDIFDKQCFLQTLFATFLIGLLAHGYCYFNSLYFFDTLAALNQNTDVAHKIQLGRYMQPLNMFLRGYIVTPWLIGILALFWITLACYLIIKLLAFQSKISEIILCGLLATNYVFTLTNASYLHEADAFMLALLFSVLAVFVFEKYKYGFLMSPLCILVSCGFYQAYFSVTVSLFMIVILKDIFGGMEPKKVMTKAIKVIVTMLVGLAIYYAVYKLILMLTGLQMSVAGNSISYNIFASENINEFFAAFYKAYRYTLSRLYNPFTCTRVATRIVTALVALIASSCYFFILKHKKINVQNIVLSLGIFALFPFATSLTVFLATEFAHDLMVYAIVFVYVLALFIIDYSICHNTAHKVAKGVAAVCLSAIIFSNIVFSNQAYVLRVLQYQSTLSTMTRVLAQMESVEGYVVGETEVVFIGTMVDSALTINREGFIVYGVGYSCLTPMHATGSFIAYFEYVLAYPINIVAVGDNTVFSDVQEVIDMPTFPAIGSVQFIEDVLFVKLSD